MKLAFIVQRYGSDILGGAEYMCRLWAERLAERHDIEVLTTCAWDDVSWKNEYPEGSDRVRGVTVRRFANAQTRDIDAFNRYSDWIFNHAHSRSDELEWLRQLGPWCPALVEYLKRHHQTFDALIFFTSLYAPTVLGIQVAPQRSILVPTAHDEAAMHLGIYEEVFGSAAGIAYNTEVERRFVASRFSIRAIAQETIGCGVDLPPVAHGPGGQAEAADGEDDEQQTADDRLPRSSFGGRGGAFRRRHRLHGPIALYGGRIEKGKGCEELVEYFRTYHAEGGEAQLVLMGVKLMPLPEDPAIRFAGLLPDRERTQALEAATVVVVPSPYESLSLLALEAFAAGTPILANARSEVLVAHCVSSRAGL
ncbi:MAG: glycosyltransferase, partial [Acidobacteria bacterium]|nr:glycosyltransferase [Acidobacteriota bacterium]